MFWAYARFKLLRLFESRNSNKSFPKTAYIFGFITAC